MKTLKDLPKNTKLTSIKVKVPKKAVILDSGFQNPSNEGYLTQVMGETWLSNKSEGDRKLNLLDLSKLRDIESEIEVIEE